MKRFTKFLFALTLLIVLLFSFIEVVCLIMAGRLWLPNDCYCIACFWSRDELSNVV